MKEACERTSSTIGFLTDQYTFVLNANCFARRVAAKTFIRDSIICDEPVKLLCYHLVL